ncbi:MAG: hypothetical protein EBS05_16830 [Proteobacteria bacterium]|nr:hypothetical protein [Pseudomonadota bacterium]
MAKLPVRPAPKKSPAPAVPAGSDPFDHLAEMLRTLFAAKAGVGAPCPECGDSPCSCDDASPGENEGSAGDSGEDAAEYGKGPMGGPVKGMRHLSISIMMPMHKPGQK